MLADLRVLGGLDKELSVKISIYIGCHLVYIYSEVSISIKLVDSPT